MTWYLMIQTKIRETKMQIGLKYLISPFVALILSISASGTANADDVSTTINKFILKYLPDKSVLGQAANHLENPVVRNGTAYKILQIPTPLQQYALQLQYKREVSFFTHPARGNFMTIGTSRWCPEPPEFLKREGSWISHTHPIDGNSPSRLDRALLARFPGQQESKIYYINVWRGKGQLLEITFSADGHTVKDVTNRMPVDLDTPAADFLKGKRPEYGPAGGAGCGKLGVDQPLMGSPATSSLSSSTSMVSRALRWIPRPDDMSRADPGLVITGAGGALLGARLVRTGVEKAAKDPLTGGVTTAAGAYTGMAGISLWLSGLGYTAAGYAAATVAAPAAAAAGAVTVAGGGAYQVYSQSPGNGYAPRDGYDSGSYIRNLRQLYIDPFFPY